MSRLSETDQKIVSWALANVEAIFAASTAHHVWLMEVIGQHRENVEADIASGKRKEVARVHDVPIFERARVDKLMLDLLSIGTLSDQLLKSLSGLGLPEPVGRRLS